MELVTQHIDLGAMNNSMAIMLQSFIKLNLLLKQEYFRILRLRGMVPRRRRLISLRATKPVSGVSTSDLAGPTLVQRRTSVYGSALHDR